MKDLSNQRFGRLVAIKPCGKNKYRNVLWLCRCDCGKEHIGEDTFREEVKKRIVAGKGQQYFINKFCGA